MPIEIERKFLVVDDSWRDQLTRSVHLHQGYLSNNKHASVRVRIEGDQANINIKGMTIGVQRPEYEYPIPTDEAQTLLDTLCMRPTLNKTRHYVTIDQHVWEVDEFHGDNAGLVVAEIELGAVDEVFTLPAWAGKEVSDQERYYNVCLIKHPYSQWSADEK